MDFFTINQIFKRFFKDLYKQKTSEIRNNEGQPNPRIIGDRPAALT